MTDVLIYLTRPDPVTGIDAPVDGVIECVPTRRRHIEGGTDDRIVLPTAPPPMRLVDGRAVLKVDATGTDWCWQITERTRGGITRTVAVPDVESIDYGDLVDVDPKTLDPTTPVIPAYQALIDAKADKAATEDALTGLADGLTARVDTDTYIEGLGSKQDKLSLATSLVYPLVIGHRGAGNLFPESTLAGYVAGAALPVQAIEGGDYRMIADGTLVDCHDATVDRTTNGTGPVADFTGPGARRLVVDSSVSFGGGWNDQQGLQTLPELLARLGGTKALCVEVKDTLDSTSAAMCRQIRAMGLESSVILSSFSLSNLAIPEADGMVKMFLTGAINPDYVTPQQLLNAGVSIFCVNITSAGDHAAYVSQFKAGGLRMMAYTIDHQYDYDAALAFGYEGVFSNDPVYTSRDYAHYRKASTQWHIDGTFSHGMLVAGTGPYTAIQRGSLVGGPGAYRWKLPVQQFGLAGAVCPITNAAGAYTVWVKFAVEAVPASSSQGACIFLASPTDHMLNVAGNIADSYLVKARASGVVNWWSVDGAGAASSMAGSLATTAWAIPTLSAGLAATVAITSLPVNALTGAVKAGHQFALPNGQVVTASGPAAVGATAIPVTSITPAVSVASGASILPFITIKIDVTPTTIAVTREDEPGTGTMTVTNTDRRGGYIVIQNAVDSQATSFHSVAVS